ncbi:pilus assembly protein PilP [Nitrospina watsonii]|uniref:DUF2059 domain-containing protein n=1 Tax=Nitrospina watsonii TaxID=1323948 RepID=A0ABN8W1M9_9BACT|nr:pilus assembly protein PilP [Nitrospina watsonii]CAI2719543.1 conserved protein of unknown function [Nitrospina watsonii]
MKTQTHKSTVPMQTGIARSLTTVVMMGMLILASWAPHAEAAQTQNKTSLVRQLFVLSGVQREKALVARMQLDPGVFTSPKLLSSLGLSQEHITLINEVYEGAFHGNEFYNTKFRQIRDGFHRTHIRRAIRFFRSPLGRRVAALEASSMKRWGDYEGFLHRLTDRPPDKERLELMDRLEKAKAQVDYEIKFKSSILRTVAPLNDFFAVTSAEKLIMKLKMELRDHQRSLHIIDNLFRYKSLNDRDLERMVRFYESPEGAWFNRVDQEGNAEGIAKMNRRASQAMSEVVRRLKSTKEDFDTLKAVFAPGLRYMFTDKRDPFVPQINEVDMDALMQQQAEAKEREERMKERMEEQRLFRSRMDQELNGLPSIPYEVYRAMKKADPRLHSDLEYYAALFKNKSELREMNKSEIVEEINNYKNLIEKASGIGASQIGSDLQNGLPELKLSGLIWNGQETVALVETPDSFGHTIRVGSLLGPKYGVVEAIDREKITILERVRDFQGNIRTQTRYLEFNKPADE